MLTQPVKPSETTTPSIVQVRPVHKTAAWAEPVSNSSSQWPPAGSWLLQSLSKVQQIVERAYKLWPDDLEGKYSITRLLAFEEYRHRRPRIWMVFLILFVPIPSAVVIIGLNFLPIANPLDGWKANYMLFVRTFLLGAIAGQCVKIKREFYFMDKQVAVSHTYSVRIVFAALMTLAFFLFSVVVKFPMPFGFLAAIFVASPTIYAGVHLFVTKARQQISLKSRRRSSLMLATREEAASLREFDKDVQGYAHMMMLHVLLFFVFPLFQVGYNNLERHQYWQFTFFMLLPLIRKVLIVFHRRNCSRVPDLSNEIVVFSVKFFVTVFKALFITSMTRIVVCVIVLWDWLELVHALVKISRQVQKIQTCVRALHKRLALLENHETNPEKVDIVTECATLVVDNRYLVHAMAREMQYRETGSFGVSFYKTKSLSKLLPFLHTSRPKPTPVMLVAPASASMSRTIPSSSNSHKQNDITSRENRDKNDEKRLAIEQQQMLLLTNTLSTLYALEYVVMTEFVESFFPFWLVAYIYCSSKSPCGSYLQGTSKFQEENQSTNMNNMLWYGLVEIASSLVLDRIAKWYFKFDLVQLLAFVLETHFVNIQAKMMFFLAVVVNFHLVHYGMDFEFKFDLRKYEVKNLGSNTTSS